MISKSQISFIKSLHQKKFRKEHGLFIAEGIKTVTEFIRSDYLTDTVFCTAAIRPKLGNLSQNIKLQETTEAELAKISTLTNPQQILAVINIPETASIKAEQLKGRHTIILDGIQDPGNLGTIIRTADWFGFKDVICSENTVEAYNPKVVQATMGSLSRMKVFYTDIVSLLKSSSVPVYGGLLNGNSIYETDFADEALLVFGNEGKGISDEVQKYITQPVAIPKFGEAESLNVAVSAGIFCSELKRKGISIGYK